MPLNSEELLKSLYDNVNLSPEGKTLTTKINGFFGNQDLTLSFRYSDGAYSVHDNGSALLCLKDNAGSDAEFKEILDVIKSNLSLDGFCVVGCFSQVQHLFHYLQILIFIAHADLYYKELSEDGLYYDNDITLDSLDECELIEKDDLLFMIKDGFSAGVCCEGTYLNVGMTYSLFNSTVSYLIEEKDGKYCISDNRKGKVQGEIFESFYWDNDNLSVYSGYIGSFCERFGGDFDGKNLSLSCDKEQLVPSLFKFINLAVLLSEFGRLIELPKGDNNG